MKIARWVIDRVQLDLLLMMPAGSPPHKSPGSVSDPLDRYAMCVIATLDEPAIKVSRLEIEAAGEPYTYQTLERLTALYDDSRLYFIMGADSLNDFPTWRNPGRILELSSVVVLSRPGFPPNLSQAPDSLASALIDLDSDDGSMKEWAPDSPGKLILSSVIMEDVSSSEIRRRARAGEPITGLTHEGVIKYVEKYKLYRR